MCNSFIIRMVMLIGMIESELKDDYHCTFQVDLVMAKLLENKKIANATHNILAYR